MRRYAVTRWWTKGALAMLDAAGGRLRRRAAPAGEVRRLLLVRRERFGDVITMLPAVERAREVFPGVRITWMVAPAYAEFIEQLGVVDEVWRVKSWLQAVLARRRRFDLALEFHGDVRAIAAARRQACRVAGYGLRGGSFWLDVDLDQPQRMSAAARHVRLVERAAGATCRGSLEAPRAERAPAAANRSPPTSDQRERPSEEWRAIVRTRPHVRWPQRGTASGYVLIHPGCGQPSKRWPAPAWRELITYCQGRSYDVALAGGPEDRQRCGELARATGARNLSGSTGWGDLAGLVASAAAVVAPDTGIIHLAQALGTATVALYGPTDPEVWGYAGAIHRVLVHPLACSHCDRGVCPRVARGAVSPCMQAITPGAVIRAVEALMAARSAAGSRPPAAPLAHGPGF